MFQTIFNGALSSGEKGRLCRRLRRWLLRFSDPLVRWELNGRTLRVNLSHQLPFYRREFPTYSSNLQRLAAALRQSAGQLRMVDVGANIGDSLAIMGVSSEDACLLIEGNPAYFSLLRENTADLRGAVCVAAMLSDSIGQSEGQLIAEGGTAKVVSRAVDSATVGMRTLDSIIEEYPQFRSAQLLKVDVDGYDWHVLRGARSWIQQVQPILFFEQDPVLLAGAGQDPNAGWSWLSQWGYDQVFFYDNLGFWVGQFPVNEPSILHQLNAYAAQRPGCYYDVAAFAPRHASLVLEFSKREQQFYETLRSPG